MMLSIRLNPEEEEEIMLWYNNPQAMRAIQEVTHGSEDDRRRRHSVRVIGRRK
jgi:hypothetical protein